MKNRYVRLFLFLFLAGLVIEAIGLAIVGQQAQVFTEYVVETVAETGRNKSGELDVFWKILAGGFVFIALFFYITNRKSGKRKITTTTQNVDRMGLRSRILEGMIPAAVCCICVLIQSRVPVLLVYGTILWIGAVILIPERKKFVIACGIVVFYAMAGLSYPIFYLFGIPFQTVYGMIISGIASFVLAWMGGEENQQVRRIFLIIQCLIPLLFIRLLVNEYEYQGETVRISRTASEIIFFGIIFVSTEIPVLLHTIRFWQRKKTDVSQLISLSSCVCIAAFFAMSGAMMNYVSSDTHHPAETLIGFWQLAEFGQRPYQEFIPVSGMFSYLLGGLHSLFGGMLTDYALSAACFAAGTAVLVILLCSRFFRRYECLLISSVFLLTPCWFGYARPNLLLPGFLILAIKGLRENRSLWLKVWVIVCLISGLYYPVYGAALCIGTMPFGCVQLWLFFREEWKEKRKKPFFWLSLFAVLGLVALCVPLLIQMLLHTLVYSSQTVLADGIAVFGQELPQGFLGWLPIFGGLKKAFYYALRYLLPMFIVWIFAALGFIFWQKRKKGEGLLGFLSKSEFLLTCGGALTLMISYTNTLVRADVHEILSRTAYILVPFGVIVLLLCLKRLSVRQGTGTFLLIFAVSLSVLLSQSNLESIDDKLLYSYELPETAVRITKEDQNLIPGLGEGFADSGLLEQMRGWKSNVDVFLDYDPECCFLGLDYAYYCAFGIKTCGQTSLGATKSIRATEENIRIIEEQKPVIFVGNAFGQINQYFFNAWLMHSDDYKYVPSYRAYVPTEMLAKMNGAETADKTMVCPGGLNLTKIPDSLGKSTDTLLEQSIGETVYQLEEKKRERTENGIRYNYKINETIEGWEADFLLIELEGLKRETDHSPMLGKIDRIFTPNESNQDLMVHLSWDEQTENYIICNYGNGRLLVPLGTNSDWFAGSHEELCLEIMGLTDREDVSVGEIKLLRSQADTLWEDQNED